MKQIILLKYENKSILTHFSSVLFRTEGTGLRLSRCWGKDGIISGSQAVQKKSAE